MHSLLKLKLALANQLLVIFPSAFLLFLIDFGEMVESFGHSKTCEIFEVQPPKLLGRQLSQ